MIPRRRFDDAEVALSWRKKYFPQGPGREPLRVKIPDLPDVFVVSIENDNTGRVVNRCREAGYSHPNAIKVPSRKRIAREVQSALIRAAAVHAQVLLDNDEDIDTNIRLYGLQVANLLSRVLRAGR